MFFTARSPGARSLLKQKHCATGLLACAAMLSGALRAQDGDAEIRRHFEAARQAQGAGQFELAAREYSAVLKLQPELAEVQANLGLVYHLLSRYDESARMLEKALVRKPGLRGASLFLGIDYVKLSQPRRAVPFLKQAVAQEPANKDAGIWLGTALWDAGQAEAAIAQLRALAKTFPSDPDVLFMLGQAYRNQATRETENVTAEVGTPFYHLVYGGLYLQQQHWTKAIGHFQRAAQKDSRLADAHIGLGEAYLRQERWDDAKQEFQRALDLDSRSAAGHARLAQVAVEQGQIREALEHVEAALTISPEESAFALGLPVLPGSGIVETVSSEVGERYRQALPALQASQVGPARSLLLAALHLRLDQEPALLQEWSAFQAAMLRRSPPSSPFDRAQTAFYKHEFATAETELHATLTTEPGNRRARYLLAQTYQFLSLNLLNHLIENAPDSFRAHQLLAQTYDQQEQNDKALAEYLAVERTNPALSGLHFAIGHLLWKLDRPGEAMAELEQELRLNPGHAEANAEIGTILANQHLADKAQPYLEKGLGLKPDLPAAHLELGKVFYQQRSYARAEQELKKALPWDPEGNVHYLLGVVCRGMGRAAESQAAFEQSRRIKAERLAGVKIGAPQELQP